METKNLQQNISVVQICHGRIIPYYSSAYSMRVGRYLKMVSNRNVVSVGGIVLKDERSGKTSQYHSLLMTLITFIKKGRLFEIFVSKGKLLRKKYIRTVKGKISESMVIIFEGPWQYRLFKDELVGKLVIYDAHNVEFLLRNTDPWENYTEEIESDLIKRADLTITVTEEDKKQFIEHFNVPLEKITCIPEGYNSSEKTWNGIKNNDVVFIGSAYLPNIRAFEYILKMAQKLPEYNFKIIGSVCDAVKKRNLPKNVKLLGLLKENDKELEISNALVAINPVEQGSGRNLKMNDYISHGIPIVTTEIGSRGFDEEVKNLFFITSVEKFPEVISSLKNLQTLLHMNSNKMLAYAEKYSYLETEKSAYKAILNLVNQYLLRIR